MNRKQNRLLFILFFALLLCMNMAKAWHIDGACSFKVSTFSKVWPNLGIFSDSPPICSESSKSEQDCVVTWRNDNTGFMTNISGGKYLQVGEHISSSHVSAENVKESDILYNLQLNDARMIKSFSYMALKTTDQYGKKIVLRKNPYENFWIEFEINKLMDSSKNRDVQSQRMWTITLRQKDFRKKIDDTNGFIEKINNGVCTENRVLVEDGDQELFGVGSPMYGIEFTVKKKDGTASQERSLLWGRRKEDGRFMVKPDFSDQLVIPDYFTGTLGEEGGYKFQFTENGSPIKISIGERLDANSKPVVTIEYPGSTVQDIAWILPVKKRAEESKTDQKISKTDQKIFTDRDMQYVYQTTFTLSRDNSFTGYTGPVETQERRIIWGSTEDGIFMIKPIFGNAMWVPVYKFGKDFFEYIDEGVQKYYPKLNITKRELLGDGGEGVEYRIKVTVRDATGNTVPKILVEYLKFKDKKTDTTRVKVKNISTVLISSPTSEKKTP